MTSGLWKARVVMTGGVARRAGFATAAVCAILLATFVFGPQRAVAAGESGINLKPPPGMTVLSDKKNAPAKNPAGKTAADAGAAGKGGWVSLCVSLTRSTAADCNVERRVALKENNRVFVMVRVTVPHQTRKPGIFIQTPLGILLRPGLMLQLDNKTPVKLDLQACDQGGCYAATPIADAFLSGMLSAKTLTLRFQSVNARTLSVPFSLDGFRPAYNGIK